jgi:outer membrane protein assembly factor BamB
LKWSYVTGGLIDTCSPAIAEDGTVYIGSNDGILYALNPDGTMKWTHSFNTTSPAATYPVSNSPAIAADGTIYVKANDGFLYALAPTNGTTKWRANVNAVSSYASPSVAPDGTIYQGSEDKKLYAFNPDGTAKWTYTADNDIYTVPALDAAGNLYFGVLNTGWFYSLTPAGTLRWIYKGASVATTSSPVLSADGATVYFSAYDKQLHAVATADGTARWTHTLGDEVRASSPAVDSNGVIYIGCYDFKLYAINPDGTRNRTWSTGNWIRSCPAISGRTLYVGSNDHKLYAIDLGATTGAGGGPWPQYRHNARRLGRAITEVLEITAAPKSQTAILGLPLTLSVVATGQAPLTYQWKKDGVVLAGSTSATYAVASATFSSAGSYSVTVTGPQGTVTSAAATVTVEPMVPGRLANLSVRTTAGTGAQTLIVGFAVAGGAKSLLVRGIGPGLTPFGVTGTLPDPKLDLFASGATTALATNDNWLASAAPVFAQVGAFTIPSNSKDAALTTSLGAGSYTAQVSDVTGATGISLVELYDTENVTASSRLTNVSARAQVGVGGGILITGFVINGNVPKNVLIRAIGPALAGFGVTGVLADPRLDLYRGTTLVESNDNWGTTTLAGGTGALSTTFAQVGAFALASATSRDAVLLVSLAPGTYTAQVSGINATTGVALVEVYEVP